MSVTVTRVLLLQLSLGIIFSALLIFFSKLNIYILIFAGLAAGFFLPVSFLTRKKSLRRDQLAEQLPDALDYIARSLRAGNPFSTSIKLISKEMGGPIAYEFGIVFDEINFGLDVEEALHGLFERTQSEDIRYFVTAVILQKTTGGNLAEVLNRIAGIIRDRARMKNEIGILSSEMRLSANIFILLPFIVAGAILFLNPDYMKPLFEHELGLKIIGLQILMMVCGYAIIQKMVRFHF